MCIHIERSRYLLEVAYMSDPSPTVPVLHKRYSQFQELYDQVMNVLSKMMNSVFKMKCFAFKMTDFGADAGDGGLP